MMLATLLLLLAVTCAILYRARTRPLTPEERRQRLLDRQHTALNMQQHAARQALQQAVNATAGNTLALCATPGELTHAQDDQSWAMPAVLVGTAFNVSLQ